MDDAHQNCPKIGVFFPQISHLSSNRREQNLAFYFQFSTPARKLTHKTKFKHFWMQKDTNFRNAMILQHFWPEKHQKSAPERPNFGNTMILQHFEQEKHQKSAPERHDFGNAIILGPENCQIQPRKTQILENCTH